MCLPLRNYRESETERMSLPISGNDMTTPYQESEEAHKQRLARVRARRRQCLTSKAAKNRQTRQRHASLENVLSEMPEEREVRLN